MNSLVLYLCWFSLLVNIFFIYIHVYALSQSLGIMGLTDKFFKL